MKGSKHKLSLVLLVTAVIAVLILLTFTSALLTIPSTGVSVADCSTPGTVCDAHGCRLSIGEIWCEGTQQCHEAGKACSTSGGGTTQPPANVCSSVAPTNSLCFGAAINSLHTYNSAGDKCKCAFTTSPSCACVKVTTAVTPPNPGLPDNPPPPPQKTPDLEVNACSASTNVLCGGKQFGTVLTNIGCTCTKTSGNNCSCLGNHSRGSGQSCVGNDSCQSGLVCRSGSGGYTCQATVALPGLPGTPEPPVTDTTVVTIAGALGEAVLSYQAPSGLSCGAGYCPSLGFTCISERFCQRAIFIDTAADHATKTDLDKYRFPTKKFADTNKAGQVNQKLSSSQGASSYSVSSSASN